MKASVPEYPRLPQGPRMTSIPIILGTCRNQTVVFALVFVIIAATSGDAADELGNLLSLLKLPARFADHRSLYWTGSILMSRTPPSPPSSFSCATPKHAGAPGRAETPTSSTSRGWAESCGAP